MILIMKCKRCGKEITTHKPESPAMRKVWIKYGCICDNCMSVDEKQELLKAQAGALLGN